METSLEVATATNSPAGGDGDGDELGGGNGQTKSPAGDDASGGEVRSPKPRGGGGGIGGIYWGRCFTYLFST